MKKHHLLLGWLLLLAHFTRAQEYSCTNCNIVQNIQQACTFKNVHYTGYLVCTIQPGTGSCSCQVTPPATCPQIAVECGYCCRSGLSCNELCPGCWQNCDPVSGICPPKPAGAPLPAWFQDKTLIQNMAKNLPLLPDILASISVHMTENRDHGRFLRGTYRDDEKGEALNFTMFIRSDGGLELVMPHQILRIDVDMGRWHLFHEGRLIEDGPLPDKATAEPTSAPQAFMTTLKDRLDSGR